MTKELGDRVWAPGSGPVDRETTAAGVVMWLVLPGLLLLLTVTGARGVGPAWRAHQGSGTSGVFTVVSCPEKGGCPVGTWTSDDGRRRLTGVHLHDGPGGKVRPGAVFRALDTGDPDGVYVAHGDAYQFAIFELGLGAAGLVLWLALVVVLRRRASR